MIHPYELTPRQLNKLEAMLFTTLIDLADRNERFELGSPDFTELLNNLTEPMIATNAHDLFPDDDDAINTLDIIFSSMLINSLMTASR